MPTYSTEPDEPTILFEGAAFEGRRDVAEQLADAVALCDPPQVFGVHGDWGAGKTSFLHYLQLRLTGECPQNQEWDKWDKAKKDEWRGRLKAPLAVSVWFEAWRYQAETAPVVALLHEMRAQLTWKKYFLEKLANSLEVGGETAFRTALMAFSDVTGKISAHAGIGVAKIGGEVGFGGPRLQEAWAATQQANLAQALPSNQLREHLDRILEDLLPSKTRSPKTPRVVVFIDDLDRCEPDAAFSLLEGIKIYLNLKSCVFVLGLNRREVERAIAKVLPTSNSKDSDSELLTRAHEYVEKLCSNAVRLPRLSQREQRVLLERWLAGAEQEQITRPLCNLLKRHEMLPANPRRIKAFANTVVRLLTQRRTPPQGFTYEKRARTVAIVASLYQFHPQLYGALERDVEAFYQTLQDFCDRSFNTPAAEEADRLAYPVPVLRQIVRPFSISTGKVVEEVRQDRGKVALSDAEKAATPVADATKRTSAGDSVFTSLYASSTAVAVLHAQTLIAETVEIEDLLIYFLGQ
jgi:hypothetical protein